MISITQNSIWNVRIAEDICSTVCRHTARIPGGTVSGITGYGVPTAENGQMNYTKELKRKTKI